MKAGGAVILSATIKPREAREMEEAMQGSGIHLIDTPVFGGFPGAQSGTLTMMAAAPAAALDEFNPVMEAVSSNIHRVGTQAGMGQTVKACLQSLIGAQFSATFEAASLAAKAGVSGQVLHDVFCTSCYPPDTDSAWYMHTDTTYFAKCQEMAWTMRLTLIRTQQSSSI